LSLSRTPRAVAHGPLSFFADRGAGKVAGKVLIVDLHYRFANLLK
jgi:hypothetical protein